MRGLAFQFSFEKRSFSPLLEPPARARAIARPQRSCPGAATGGWHERSDTSHRFDIGGHLQTRPAAQESPTWQHVCQQTVEIRYCQTIHERNYKKNVKLLPTCASSSSPRLMRLETTLGLSGPRDHSKIVVALTNRVSASTYLPCAASVMSTGGERENCVG